MPAVCRCGSLIWRTARLVCCAAARGTARRRIASASTLMVSSLLTSCVLCSPLLCLSACRIGHLGSLGRPGPLAAFLFHHSVSCWSHATLRRTVVIGLLFCSDQQSRELSQGHLLSKSKSYKTKVEELRLPQIVDFVAREFSTLSCVLSLHLAHARVCWWSSCADPAKEREWANIVSCHEDDAAAYTWLFEQKASSLSSCT